MNAFFGVAGTNAVLVLQDKRKYTMDGVNFMFWKMDVRASH